MSWSKPVNAAGYLYGAIVTGALFSLAGAHPADYPRLLGIVVLTLVMYWLSHVYVRVVSDRLADPTEAYASRLREAVRHELAVLTGGVPAIVAYVVFVVFGWTDRATTAALWTTVVVLGGFGYRIGRAEGAGTGRLVLEVLGCSLFGVVLIVGKALLH